MTEVYTKGKILETHENPWPPDRLMKIFHIMPVIRRVEEVIVLAQCTETDRIKNETKGYYVLNERMRQFSRN